MNGKKIRGRLGLPAFTMVAGLLFILASSTASAAGVRNATLSSTSVGGTIGQTCKTSSKAILGQATESNECEFAFSTTATGPINFGARLSSASAYVLLYSVSLTGERTDVAYAQGQDALLSVTKPAGQYLLVVSDTAGQWFGGTLVGAISTPKLSSSLLSGTLGQPCKSSSKAILGQATESNECEFAFSTTATGPINFGARLSSASAYVMLYTVSLTGERTDVAYAQGQDALLSVTKPAGQYLLVVSDTAGQWFSGTLVAAVISK